MVILFIKAVSILQFKPGIEEDDFSVSARESEVGGGRSRAGPGRIPGGF